MAFEELAQTARKLSKPFVYYLAYEIKDSVSIGKRLALHTSSSGRQTVTYLTIS